MYILSLLYNFVIKNCIWNNIVCVCVCVCGGGGGGGGGGGIPLLSPMPPVILSSGNLAPTCIQVDHSISHVMAHPQQDGSTERWQINSPSSHSSFSSNIAHLYQFIIFAYYWPIPQRMAHDSGHVTATTSLFHYWPIPHRRAHDSDHVKYYFSSHNIGVKPQLNFTKDTRRKMTSKTWLQTLVPTMKQPQNLKTKHISIQFFLSTIPILPLFNRSCTKNATYECPTAIMH